MSDAPALTDEQIDEAALMAVREAFVRGRGQSYGGSAEAAAIRDEQRRREFHTWLAAHDTDVIARAKREERERLIGAVEVATMNLDGPFDDYGRGLRNGLVLAAGIARREASHDC